MTEQPLTATYQKPAEPKQAFKPTRLQILAAAGSAAALMLGIAIGQGTAPDKAPAECAVALDYSEEALGLSADGFDVMSDALGGGIFALGRVSTRLDPITRDLKRITPLYQAARSACLK